MRPEEERLPSEPVQSKWDLWAGGETILRGADIWQALVIPELDGPDLKGSGHVGSPYVRIRDIGSPALSE